MADDQTDPTDDRQAEATEPAADDSGPAASSETDEKAPAKTSGPAKKSGTTKGSGPGKKSGPAKSAGAAKKSGSAKGAGGEGAAVGDDATPKVVRKKVTSKRVTPKGGAQGAKVTSSPVSEKSKARFSDDDEPGFSKRYTPPQGSYADGPSPMWVPVLMFALLIIGALVIMLNYMELFGEPSNIRLVIGLGFILGGIIAATQYR